MRLHPQHGSSSFRRRRCSRVLQPQKAGWKPSASTSCYRKSPLCESANTLSSHADLESLQEKKEEKIMRKAAALLLLVGVTALGSNMAEARVDVGIGIGIPLPAVVAPPPVLALG